MINAIKRTLTMLEKSLDRLARQCFHDPKQYPDVFHEIEECINVIRSWLNKMEIFQSLQFIHVTLSTLIDELSRLISQLWETCKPSKGKKGISKAHTTFSRAICFAKKIGVRFLRAYSESLPLTFVTHCF